jgi:flagella basal body P-ring formation protein FlgA
MSFFGKLIIGSAVLLHIICSQQSVVAEDRNIKILGRSSVTVTAEKLRLEDVADVSSPHIADDEAVIAMKKIELGASPAPGQKTTLSAMSILEALKASQVDLNKVGYSLPSVVAISRAGREVSEEEVRAAIESALSSQQREITIKQVKYDQPVQVAPGALTLQAQELFNPAPGQMAFMVTARSPGVDDMRFKVSAVVEEWRELPVAARSLPRGTLLEPSDIVMARLNTRNLPRDIADTPSKIIGMATSSGIGNGDAFQRSKLIIPPTIEIGAPVTMIVRSGSLEATASGVALEAGADGDEIKVRNDSSKRIVTGKIIGTGSVLVSPVRSMP